MHLMQLIAIASLALTLASQVVPQTGFDSSRAYRDLEKIVSFGPRPAGSASLALMRKYLTEQLTAASAKATEQAWDDTTPIGKINMVNVIGTMPGTRPDRIIFAGHYDTKLFKDFRFVGANDGGSSAAFLLELARVLKGRRNPFTIEFLFLDGEEAIDPVKWDPLGEDHTYGSRHYVEAGQQSGTLKQIRALILVDMIGDRSLNISREAASTSWLTDLIWASARRLGYQHNFLDASAPIEDDHLPFLGAGVNAVDVIDLDYAPWHTVNDTLDKVSAHSLQVVGDVLIDALPKIEARLLAGGTTSIN